MNKATEICPTTAFGLTQEGVLLVDVREPEEIAEASFDVPNLMLIPYSQFEQRYREIPADRQVIIACHVGERSLMATCFLMNHGYRQAVNMQYGIERWAEKNFPVKGTVKKKAGCCCCGGGGHAASNGNAASGCC